MTDADTESAATLRGRFPAAFLSILSGFSGLLACGAYIFELVPVEYAILFGMWGSAMAALLGIHANAMGWFDE